MNHPTHEAIVRAAECWEALRTLIAEEFFDPEDDEDEIPRWMQDLPPNIAENLRGIVQSVVEGSIIINEGLKMVQRDLKGTDEMEN